MMMERRCWVKPCGAAIVARLAVRFVGGDQWVVLEEFDVTLDVQALVQAALARQAAPAPAEGEEVPGGVAS